MISRLLIEKWKRMLHHESVLHIEQKEGQFYSITEINGYYNDLRGKVYNTKNIDKNGIPYNIAANKNEKRKVYFPIAIFQYGLGAYDLWLETGQKEYLEKALKMAEWAIKHQSAEGSWDTFGVLNYHNPFSAMAQGEAASLYARAYKETHDEKYKKGCIKAIDFMLRSVENGGTAICKEHGVILFEYPDKPVVLNGWLFAGFGVFDCWKITDDEKMYEVWKKIVLEVEQSLYIYDTGCWSYYDCNKKYASPFYHKLHIALLNVYYALTGSEIIKEYANKWEKNKMNKRYAQRAFVIKAWQKITEKKSEEWIFVS